MADWIWGKKITIYTNYSETILRGKLLSIRDHVTTVEVNMDWLNQLTQVCGC